ncbi:PSD1 and planctomycete cytochrome C domain-containing protein [uncultured Gimesia sp.]|uniref:PSD1 and planctomycete cytochrome C domain-containing protein n=1 Tax=uncultured Gimesia sp. TaxID=1678688 RepID=UPI002636128A|nr:PSD1 and planctomycete cytochrome C domain-containing protein [uncultured Gimesia sp.]
MLNQRGLSITLLSTVILVMSLKTGLGAEVRFNEDIRPILAEHCLHCHGPDAEKRQADLRLDIERAAKESAIVSMKPNESEFFRRITSKDPDLRMPPADTGKSLSAKQIALVRKWIQNGAPYQGHWSFEPIQKPKRPPVGNSTTKDIDRFIVAALNERGLKLSPAINRQQLIRRASFDLTGLPPTWEEVLAFVNDQSPQAFEKVVDRLLDSPRYGERWGRHWLDIARFADTHGGSAIGFKKFPFSYTYRDYVIRAFNADLPYNRFVTEQLAADQLGLKINDPALAAIGFLTIGMQFRNPHDIIDDQIDVVTRGLLGLTVACARCHDHKYDAIPTEDYYSLYATLGSSRLEKLPPILGQPPETKPYREYQEQLSRRQVSYNDMGREQSAIMRGRLRMQVGLYLRELAKGTPEQDLSATFLSYRTDDLRPLVLNRWRKYLAGLPANDPVFGPWIQLSRLKTKEGFRKQCQTLIQSLVKENGDPKKQAGMEKLTASAPRWNPRVLEAISKQQPASLLELADVYGKLFADVQQQWLKVLMGTSLEARTAAQLIPDEDPRHLDANSPINRQLRRHLYAPNTPTAMSEEIATTLLNRTIRDNLNGRDGAIHNLHLTSPGSPPRAMALREDPLANEFHVFRRGNPIDRGKPVQARFLTALSAPDANPFPVGKQRLGLAQSIVDPSNPLTRRVIVNWVWQHHFGVALVRTPDDFGTRGQPPTHPELIDYLAATFLEDGWSLKKLHRRIMLTQVYQQAALEEAESRVKDPENKFLWRMPRRKIEMEAMRDSMLMVSGELDTTMGGRPFDLLAKSVTPRRSVYAFVNRDIVSSLASTFDGANPSSCTAQRPNTNVPQQTLFALNSSFIQDRAATLVSRKEMTSAKNDAERVRLLYQRTFSRFPEPQEVEIALRYIQSQSVKPKTNPWQRLAHVLLAANEFVFVD